MCSAMYGDSFCVSGKRVKALMGRNALSGVVSDRLAVFVLIVGQIAGIAASCMLTGMLSGYNNVLMR